MASCKAGLQLLSSTFAHRSPSAAICYQQVRYGPVVMVCECWRCTHPLRHRCGMGGVPEFWGKPSPYTEGTAFLGTPTNHDEVLWNAVVMRIESTQKVHHPPTQLVRKRPLSPDAFDINGKGVHYHFQSNAISSITNRITGVVLSFGFAGLGAVSLLGAAPAAVAAVKATPILLYPAKAAVSFSLVYHYLGGLRHFAWDYGKIGKQSESNDLLELSKVQTSSNVLLGASAAVALGMTVLRF